MSEGLTTLDCEAFAHNKRIICHVNGDRLSSRSRCQSAKSSDFKKRILGDMYLAQNISFIGCWLVEINLVKISGRKSMRENAFAR